MKVLLIFNNFAGNKRASTLLRDVQHELHIKKIDYDLEIPAYPGNGAEIVAESVLSNYDAVVAAGGDGTLYEVVNGLMKNPAKEKPPIGIIPIGTGNAFVRDMPLLTEEWKKSIEIIKTGKTRKIDLGAFTTEGEKYYFLNILGLGFVADVGDTADKIKLVGNFSYTLGVLYQTLFLKPTPMTIKADDRELNLEALFVEVSNSQYTANFLMAPFAELDDGLLDVTICKPLSRLKLLQSFPKILSGEHVYMKEVIHFTTKKIEIVAQKPKILTPDGELMGSTPVSIECLQQKISVFWP
jgi:YegS/Rv2252/BmrU family lipid kinase